MYNLSGQYIRFNQNINIFIYYVLFLVYLFYSLLGKLASILTKTTHHSIGYMLRKLSSDDIPQLAAIEVTTQISPWSKELFQQCFQMAGQGWGMESSEGAIIGFILIIVQAKECHILNFCVDIPYQHQGYGQQLLLHTLTEIQQQGVTIVYLEARRTNTPAIALYQKTGFKKIGERKNYYLSEKGHEDAWVFAKILGNP
jgi:ribosomal-protein-alanine N-acetyltransferase